MIAREADVETWTALGSSSAEEKFEASPVVLLIGSGGLLIARLVAWVCRSNFEPIIVDSARQIEPRAPWLRSLRLTIIDSEVDEAIQSCHRLRRANCAAPILVLDNGRAAFSEQEAFEAGASEVVKQPLDLERVVPRAEALMRIATGILSAKAVVADGTAAPIATEDRFVRRGDLVLDCANLSIEFDGRSTSLTCAEFELLRTLALRSMTIVRYEDLAQQALGAREGESVRARVRQRVHHLMRKIGPAGDLIKNVRGVGYRLEHLDNVPRCRQSEASAAFGVTNQ